MDYETQEMPQMEKATNQLFDIIAGLTLFQAVRVAAELNIAELLKDNTLSIEELAEKTGAQSSALYRLLRFLANEGVFIEQDNKRFAQNEASHYLRGDVPFSLKGFILYDHYAEWQWKTVCELSHTIKTGEPAFDKAHKTNIWHYLTEVNPQVGIGFSHAMTNLSNTHNQAMAEAYDFSTSKVVMDVGGAYGSLLTEILKRNQHLQGMLFDIPTVIQPIENSRSVLSKAVEALAQFTQDTHATSLKLLEDAISAVELINVATKAALVEAKTAIEQNRYDEVQQLLAKIEQSVKHGVLDPNTVSLHTGSFLEKVPSGTDIFFLRYILHDWNDEDCLKILKNCRTAAPTAKVLIIERVISPEQNRRFTLALDLWMMMLFNNAKERTEQEYAHLFEQSGYKLAQVVSVGASPFSIIEAIPN